MATGRGAHAQVHFAQGVAKVVEVLAAEEVFTVGDRDSRTSRAAG